jgi:hypothetical protein
MKNTKKLIVGFMLAAGLIGVASAAPILTAPNDINGYIVLTDDQGSCGQEMDVYLTTTANMQVVTTGCWTTDDNDTIIGVDDNGVDVYRWTSDSFTPTAYGSNEYGL